MKVLALVWLNIVFYILFVFFTLLAVVVLTPFVVCQAPFVSRRVLMRQIRRAIGWYGYVVVYVLPFPFIRLHYEDRSGAGHLGPCVVVCNHRSSSDPFLVGALPLVELVQVVKKWTMRLPILGVVAGLGEYLSINEMSPEEFFARAGQLLREGVPLVAFPEGTRSGGREMGPFHSTVFRLALQEKVPIVPVCISGNERTPPRGSLLLHPGRVRMRQLPALTWDEYKDLTPFQLKNKVRDVIGRELDLMEKAG